MPEAIIPRLYGVMGSSYITNLAFSVIVVWRNRAKQDKLEEISHFLLNTSELYDPVSESWHATGAKCSRDELPRHGLLGDWYKPRQCPPTTVAWLR